VALGAFVGGMLVARSDISHEVLGQIVPLRNLFSGLFFVSVGMLIDPNLVVDDLHLVALGVALIVVVKGAMVSGLSRAFRFRPSTALLSGVILGQSAEFSFLLARVGTEVDAVSTEVFGLMLTSAAASIVLAPFLLRAAQPIAASLDRRVAAVPESYVAEPPVDVTLRDHAVVCGYGRVGRVILGALERANVKCLVIDQDRAVMDDLRRGGAMVLRGDAANAVLLDRAGVGRAWALVVAIPDPLAARQVVSLARRLNPRIDIVVRTHSAAERMFLESQGANEALVGELVSIRDEPARAPPLRHCRSNCRAASAGASGAGRWASRRARWPVASRCLSAGSLRRARLRLLVAWGDGAPKEQRNANRDSYRWWRCAGPEPMHQGLDRGACEHVWEVFASRAGAGL